jgi:mono/diheme cytochrome c family protein
MQAKKLITVTTLVLMLAAFAAARLMGQAPERVQGPPQGARGGQGSRGPGFNDFPSRPAADPAVVERGKQIFALHCAFCHGKDARGGSEGGPNLLRSNIVLNDKNGEAILAIVQNGRGGMPKIDVTAAQVADIATFIHSFPIIGRDPARELPVSIVSGDAKTGERVFGAKCASCHSVTGDLKGFGGRSSDPTELQQAWLMPAGWRGGANGITHVPPITATVTLPSGEKFEGQLMRIDDFLVSLQLKDGANRSFRRNGDVPKVEVHDPLAAHKALLRTYTDKDIHDVTAYQVTIR